MDEELEKKINREIIKFKRWNVIRKVVGILLILTFVFGLPIILYGLIFILEKLGVTITEDIIRSILTGYSIGLLIFIFELVSEFINKKKINSKQFINEWLDDLRGGEVLLESIFSLTKSDGVLSNLNKIKNILLNTCENDTSKLTLLRDYYTVIRDHGKNKIFLQAILTAIFSLMVFLYQKNLPNDLVASQDLNITIPSFILILGVLAFLITKEINKNIKKYNIIIKILNQCIEENSKNS